MTATWISTPSPSPLPVAAPSPRSIAVRRPSWTEYLDFSIRPYWPTTATDCALAATDETGWIASTERMINVAGSLKLGNFALSFNDLTVPVSGIPITVTRTYDSLTADRVGEFGYGWRLEFRDVQLRTSLLAPTSEMTEIGLYRPFYEGARVYVTLPGGQRQGFTFKPELTQLSGLLLKYGSGLPAEDILTLRSCVRTGPGSYQHADRSTALVDRKGQRSFRRDARFCLQPRRYGLWCDVHADHQGRHPIRY